MAGVALKKVVNVLESIAPLKLAGDWDNVGLLVEPSAPHHVYKMMLTNDLTLPVLQECIQKDCNFILSYHPPIFRALKRLRQTDVKEQIDRKSTRLNSSHRCISYAVFCLKKKKKNKERRRVQQTRKPYQKARH